MWRLAPACSLSMAVSWRRSAASRPATRSCSAWLLPCTTHNTLYQPMELTGRQFLGGGGGCAGARAPMGKMDVLQTSGSVLLQCLGTALYDIPILQTTNLLKHSNIQCPERGGGS